MLGWWYTLFFGLPLLAILSLLVVAVIGYRRKKALKFVGVWVIAMIIIILLMLFVPLPDARMESPPHGKLITRGNWVTVWEHPTDKELVVKQWHTVSDRRPLNHKIFNKYLVNKEHRSFFDYYAWLACMIPQWQNVEYAQKYHGQIHGVPAATDVNLSSLSWTQSRGYPVSGPIGDHIYKTDRDLAKHDLILLDLHALNVMQDKHGDILYVDGELMKKGIEYHLTLALYESLGYRMMPVGETKQILWSYEEEDRIPPIDSTCHLGKLRKGAYT